MTLKDLENNIELAKQFYGENEEIKLCIIRDNKCEELSNFKLFLTNSSDSKNVMMTILLNI
jgi:hypothetical protein